jgi:hypothetical protein
MELGLESGDSSLMENSNLINCGSGRLGDMEEGRVLFLGLVGELVCMGRIGRFRCARAAAARLRSEFGGGGDTSVR